MKKFYRFALTKSQSGGIGRHVGFKIRCSQGRVGSSPTFGTKGVNSLLAPFLYYVCSFLVYSLSVFGSVLKCFLNASEKCVAFL